MNATLSLRRQIFGSLVPVWFSLLLVGCTHTLEIKNLDRYRAAVLNPQDIPAQRPTITVRDQFTDVAARQLVDAVAAELQKHADVTLREGKPTEYTTMIVVHPKYVGKSQNFWISWPGFLVWAPAWHGFMYEVNWDMDLTLTAGTNPEPFDKFSLPIFLDLRHASINRTWCELGWLEWGITPLVGGFFFVKYDNNVTPLVVEKVHERLGGYVAAEILKRIAAHSAPAAATNAPPPAISAPPAAAP